MTITINLRNIPEIEEAYRHRINRKDSFSRWIKNNFDLFRFE